MERYKIEEWPPRSSTGMCTGKPSAGVKITDTETGESVIETRSPKPHVNKAKAFMKLITKEKPLAD